MRSYTLWLLCVVGAAALVGVNGDDVWWWESAVVYQIYPRSFKDSDGDGIGDLNGITSKLSYLQELGVNAIWMSPIYKSPMYDFGYDIADFKAIAAEYGTMDDFDNLMTQAKNRSIRVIMDYVPNHTSNESDWFVKSAFNNDTYADYYIWVNGTDNNASPPNNWLSVFRKSAWEFSEVRQQYYLHQFVIGQPDLNYRSAVVREEMKNVLRFWLDKGVSGFRIDAVNFLFEVNPADYGGVYPSEPLSNVYGYGPEDYEYLDHIYTKDQEETYGVVYDWRAVLDEYTESHNESKLMMTEGYTELSRMMRYYGNSTNNGSIPFNFVFLGELNMNSTAKDMQLTIEKWMTYMPAGKVANWVNGNHDQSRLATRHGVNRVDAMNMLALLLPGVTITYQGEELGMTDGYVSWADTKDPQACNTDDPINYASRSRDPERTPFHWDTTANAGFSNATSTWLPVASNYLTVNVAVQQAANRSHYHFYKDVVALKNSTAVSTGDLGTKALSDTILVVTRYTSDDAIVGIINLGDSSQSVTLSSIASVPDNMTVVATGIGCTLQKGANATKSAGIIMPAHCAITLQKITSDAFRITASILVYCILYMLYAFVN